jgi:cytochrome b561
MALLILVTALLGLYAASFERTDMTRMPWVEAHKSCGLIALALAALRILWLLHSPAPRAASSLKNWERRAAWLSHRALYLLLLVIPITGFLLSQTAGREVTIFGVVTIPQLVPIDLSVPAAERPLMGLWVFLHKEVLDLVLLTLVSVHVFAVIKHQFFDREPGILRRMWGR